jgi:signal transduction histidine kinase/DNA-binding response OmpR family regulator
MNKQILIVDDDQGLRKTLTDIFTVKGYEPITASTGEDAIHIAAKQAPAIALIDLRLEDMPGLDVLKQIKEENEYIVCIVLTGYATQRTAIDAVNLGAYSYFQKPYNVDQLLLTIRHAIEKQEADQALRESQALLRATGKMAKIGGWELNTATGEAVWTEALYHIHKVPDDYRPTLSRILAFYPPEARDKLETSMEAAIQTGAPFDMKLPFIAADDQRLWIHIMGKAEYTGDTITKISGTFQDITELRKAEEALRTSNERLQDTITQLEEAEEQIISQERMNAIAQLVAGLAHEFNNMMVSVVLYTQMMLQGSNLSSKDRERVADIHEQAQRAAHMTQQLLDFSRRATLWKKNVEVAAILYALRPQIQRALPDDISAKIVDKTPPATHIHVDPERIQQALANMVYNARDAMPDGGELTIQARFMTLSPDETPPVPDMEPGDWVEFNVTDTGTGIAEKDLPHIFEPFFTTRTPMRSGLGLSQVFGIIMQHRGHITVDTTLGEGTTFHVYLPTPPHQPSQQTKAEEEQLALVIEEHDLVRDALGAALENLNYDFIAIAKPPDVQAIDAAQAQRIKFVLSDITDMPGSILTFVDKMRERFPNARIILIGESSPPPEIEALIQRKQVRWLKKPTGLANLAKVLADI